MDQSFLDSLRKDADKAEAKCSNYHYAYLKARREYENSRKAADQAKETLKIFEMSLENV